MRCPRLVLLLLACSALPIVASPTPAAGQIIAPGSELENVLVYIPVNGEITPRLCERVEADIAACLEQGVRHIAFDIDSTGGDLAAALQLAREIGRGRYASYAVIDNDGAALDAAALIAVACETLVLGVKTRIGGFDLTRPRSVPPEELAVQLGLFGDANPAYPSAILRAWVTPGTPVTALRYANARGRRTEYVLPQELPSRRGPNVVEEVEIPWVEIAELDDQEALKFGLVSEIHASRSRFITSHAPVRNLNPLDLDEALGRRVEGSGAVLDVFRDNPFPRWLKFLLILLGTVGLVVEMKLPGTFVGGAVFTVAFSLFFLEGFANQMVGWTEIVLFPTAFVLIALELFVIPGFGVAGVLGLVLLFTSLTLGLMPQEAPLSWGSVTTELSNVILALAGSGVVVVAILRLLPGGKAERGGGLISTTRLDGDGRVPEAARAMGDDGSELVGRRGRVERDLRPAGKVIFDGESLPRDVVARGAFVPRGSLVEVHEVEGNRVVVDTIEETP